LVETVTISGIVGILFGSAKVGYEIRSGLRRYTVHDAAAEVAYAALLNIAGGVAGLGFGKLALSTGNFVAVRIAQGLLGLGPSAAARLGGAATGALTGIVGANTIVLTEALIRMATGDPIAWRGTDGKLYRATLGGFVTGGVLVAVTFPLQYSTSIDRSVLIRFDELQSLLPGPTSFGQFSQVVADTLGSVIQGHFDEQE
jgi:hypothetical protein